MKKTKILLSRNFGNGINTQVAKAGKYIIKKNTTGYGTVFYTHKTILKIYQVLDDTYIRTSLLCSLNISINVFPYKELEIEIDENLVKLIKTNSKLGLKLLKIKLKELHKEEKLTELSITQ